MLTPEKIEEIRAEAKCPNCKGTGQRYEGVDCDMCDGDGDLWDRATADMLIASHEELRRERDELLAQQAWRPATEVPEDEDVYYLLALLDDSGNGVYDIGTYDGVWESGLLREGGYRLIGWQRIAFPSNLLPETKSE